MINRFSFLALCLVGASTAAEKVSVGPYFLGMTAAQARAVGIDRCAPWANLTKCAATYGPLKDTRSFTLIFDNSTKTVQSIELKTEIVLGKPDATSNFKPAIDVPECRPERSERHTCFHPPDKLLTKEMSSYSSHKTFDGYIRTTITAEVNRAKVAAFMHAKRSAEEAQRKATAIQSGK